MVSRRTSRVGAALLGLAALTGLGYALRWRKNPSPCPYARYRWLEVPRPGLSRSRLSELLAPRPGEDVLEVGPGTGYYTGTVAGALGPDGTLHAVDVQREMVEHLRARTRRDGHENVEATRGDARALPYSDDSVDAAYLTLVLGETSDQDAALSELYRVVKPGGRLVVGESLPDPHFVPLETLKRRAKRQGFRFDDHVGTRVGYVARFSVPLPPGPI